MPRYIDADALLENLKRQYGEELGWWCTVNMSDVGMMIEDAPTANVEPIADTVKKMQERLKQAICNNTYPDFNKDGKPINVWKATAGYDLIDQIANEILVGVGK